MDELKMDHGLTRKGLVEEAKCQPYVVDYLRSCGRLPILRSSPGSGTAILYSRDAVAIINDHLARKQPKKSADE